MSLVIPPKANKTHSKCGYEARKRRGLFFEALEDRRVLALLGITPLPPIIGLPALGSGTGSPPVYDGNVSGLSYSDGGNSFDIRAVPNKFVETTTSVPSCIGFKSTDCEKGTATPDLQIHVNMDSAGNPTIEPGDDLVITGAIDNTGDSPPGSVNVDGTLLTGEIVAFGYQDNGDTAVFDFRFSPTGGLLFSNYAGNDIGVRVFSDVGSTFDGDFSGDFAGNAKVTVGIIPKLGPPCIEVVKLTNGVDDATIVAGQEVVWTYQVTNCGNVPFTKSEITIVDDNGTSGTGDDFSIANGRITYLSGDDVAPPVTLSPGETWTYTASDVAQNLGSVGGSTVTFDFSGSSALTGTNGNIRTFSSGSVNVGASAFSRNKTDGSWEAAYLGQYGGGLGVTDRHEDGSSNTHTVDNVGGYDNYVVLKFDQSVVIDSAFLGYVVNDSDLTVWIGSLPGNYDAAVTPTDGLLSSFYSEENLTTLTTTRSADLNDTNRAGNVVIIAANVADTSPEDYFKLKSATIGIPVGGCYTNKAVVTVPGGSADDTSGYCNSKNPGIDIEKTTNGPTNTNPTAPDYDNEDAMNGPGVPKLAPGSMVTWTYKVTNTGDLPFTAAQIVVTDDNGTPGTGDDITPTRVLASDVGSDGILSPGEVWLYTASGTVQNVGSSGSGSSATFDFSGSSSTNGTAGNIRTFSAGGVSVKTSAFSRDKSNGAWSTAYLGSYGGGLGVTDGSEDGSSNTHTVDNVGRDNYVLFEFSENVIVDSAFLGYVVGDSDLQVWIGNKTDAFNTHGTLSDAYLASLGFNEVNATTMTTTRTADLNAGNVAGNVIVIAADPGDTTPDDWFKIEKATVTTVGCYENKGTVTVPGGLTDSDLSHYCNPVTPPPSPGIDIEKKTTGSPNANQTAPTYDNEDAANGAGVPLLTPGTTVTWTYQVTNTGNVAFASNQVVVTDDNGTPGDASDDMSTAPGDGITFLSVQTGDADNVLEPGEVWLYQATGIVKALPGGAGATTTTFDFSGSSALDGSNGNIRTFSSGGVSVKASGFSRDSSGVWSTAWLGAYGGGLGVTDNSEGDGSNNMHTVDNVGDKNYVLFEFDQSIVVDAAYLGYVVNDSDLKVWIGAKTNPYGNHQNLNDAYFTGLASEYNLTDLTTARWADLNSGNLTGNVLIIAANPDDDTPEDRFKIELLKVKTTEQGVYENKGTVTVPGDSDSDLSHYKNAASAPNGSISGYVYKECDGDGCKESGEYGLPGVTVKLYTNAGALVAETTTTSNGSYKFDGLAAGTYKLVETQPADYLDGKEKAGSRGGTVGSNPGDDFIKDIALAAGANSTDNNFAELVGGMLSGYVYKDNDNDGRKEYCEYGIKGVKIVLTGIDDLGRSVYRETWTNSNGYYEFDNLWSGCYSITECDPSGYYDGIDSLGTLGGTRYNDKFKNIYVDFCCVGKNYNFGERACR